MYYSCQPTTTCSDQSQQMFSNVSSFLFVLGFASLMQKQSHTYFSVSFLSLFFIASILASLVW